MTTGRINQVAVVVLVHDSGGFQKNESVPDPGNRQVLNLYSQGAVSQLSSTTHCAGVSAHAEGTTRIAG